MHSRSGVVGPRWVFGFAEIRSFWVGGDVGVRWGGNGVGDN